MPKKLVSRIYLEEKNKQLLKKLSKALNRDFSKGDGK